jgi:hypothetical protein
MKELFIIKTGTPDYDPDIDDLNMYYYKERVGYSLILVGGFLLLIALLYS